MAAGLVLCGAGGAVTEAYAQPKSFSAKPGPMAEKAFSFPKYEKRVLSNGLTVFIIEDHQQPVVSFQLSITPGSVADGSKPGMVEMATYLMTRGTSTMSGDQIASTLDGIDWGVTTNAGGDALSMSSGGLKKFFPRFLEVMGDILATPTFPQEELDKLRPQMIASVKQKKSNPQDVLQSLARRVIYGENHPYSAFQTEESVSSVSVEDVKNFHSTYVRPENAYLAIVGDVKPKEVIDLLEKNIAKKWKKGSGAKVNIPEVSPMPKGIYYVERPASVQSVVAFTSLTTPRNHPDYEKIDLASDMLVGGFGGRLLRTLRETYSFTYSPFGYVSGSRFANRFVAGAAVRSEVTDSTIMVTAKELADLASKPVESAGLERMKRYKRGTYLMFFTKPSYAGTVLINSAQNGIDIETQKKFPERLMTYTAQDVQNAAAKYLNPMNMSIVVVGQPETAEELTKYGPVYRYDLDLKPATAVKLVDAGITSQEFLDKYIAAIGGKAKVDAITSVKKTTKIKLSAGPQSFDGTSTTVMTPGARSFSDAALPPVMTMKSWSDGKTAWESTNGMPPQAKEGAELEESLLDAAIFPIVYASKNNWQITVKGKDDKSFVVSVKGPQGTEKTFYLDQATMLPSKVEFMMNSPQGPIPAVEKLADYAEFGGLKFPKKEVREFGPMSISQESTYEVNVPVDGVQFAPAK